MKLDSNVRYLKGVGEEREKLFAKLGIQTLRELVGHFPRAYEDRTVYKRIDSLTVGETVCVCAMAGAPPKLSLIRKGMTLVKFPAVDETGSLQITFFNAPYVKDAIKQGETYTFYGKISGTLILPEMTNPIFERSAQSGIEEDAQTHTQKNAQTGRIVPIYPLTAKLTQRALASAVRNALDKCGDELPDILPNELSARYKLCKASFAYHYIHFPESFRDLDIARRRLIFEELFALVAAMRLFRNERGVQAGIPIQTTDFHEFYAALSFEPTKAQIRAINETIKDMSSGKLMSRLIQGDVGSGKTLVAAACAWAVWRAGRQSAFMAPTEILAKQHFSTLSALLEPLGMSTGLLLGSMTAKGKRETYEKLRCGEIDLIIGTHALISEGVEFQNLSLVVTDEQHRFGVGQRSMLAEKGDNPHVMVMSATPIPRTLALIIYGDLDVSIIDEMPPGRQKIETHIVGESHRERVYGFVRKLVSEGRQVYIICPMVEEMEDEGESTGLKSVKDYHEQLSKKVFPDLSVALVHGKMATKAKDAAMSAFTSGNANILVATTVVEVGVDVPNAALMLIENADMFGLSQLHQLRGRVGRGGHESHCILFQTANTQETTRTAAAERLQIMKSTNDGFKIAEEDLKLRGPGDFFGSRQHGLPEMRIANLMTDMLVLREAQEAAEELLHKDPALTLPEHRKLAEHIMQLFTTHTDTLS